MNIEVNMMNKYTIRDPEGKGTGRGEGSNKRLGWLQSINKRAKKGRRKRD